MDAKRILIFNSKFLERFFEFTKVLWVNLFL